MARRRKKYRKIPLRPRPTMPTVYECPHCGARMLSVTIEKKERNEQGLVKAVIRCGSCGLQAVMWVPEIFQPVDVYSKFLDAFLEGKIEYTFLKTSEERPSTPTGSGVAGEPGAAWESGEPAEEKA